MRISDWSSDVCSSDLGDIDWEYGAAGRFGVRAGDTGLFYGKVGYRWVNFDALGPNSGDYGEMVYGVGTEFAPAGKKMNDVRVRLEVDTYGDAHRFRSEEQTSELQSLMRTSYAVFCLKNTKNNK